MSPGLRVPGTLSCLLDTKLAQVPEQSSQQDTTASQMIRLHVLMPRSTRKIQDGVWVIPRLLGHGVETAFVAWNKGLPMALYASACPHFGEEKGLWSVVK